MRFSSDKGLPDKADRARLLGLALSILLLRGGERVGLTGAALPPRRGNPQILRLAELLCQEDTREYAPPEHRGMIPHARAIFISDFLGDLDPVRTGWRYGLHHTDASAQSALLWLYGALDARQGSAA